MKLLTFHCPFGQHTHSGEEEEVVTDVLACQTDALKYLPLPADACYTQEQLEHSLRQEQNAWRRSGTIAIKLGKMS